MATCKHGNRAPDDLLSSLHENQGGFQRHKCTECAYAAGYKVGESRPEAIPQGNEECQEGRRAPEALMQELPENQGYPGRHKCCVCAYHAGFEDAIKAG